MLHMINKAPDHPRFQLCLHALVPGDTLILTESAVLALTDTAFAPPCPTFALAADVNARGLNALATPEWLIDYSGWVRITADHQQSVNW
ncbi:MAG TPA: sulfurtransferase complex subunit TusB [Marinobacter sp.]|jgi:tRNA 2-thiouridine synthesizing protein B|nr:sulfurtransferase complex subunit TusB [Marinobacter sp.]